MSNDGNLLCDGCGQSASAEHLAARFRRLEWATRWRPLHIQTLLLGAVAPADDGQSVYADAETFVGEAAWVLRVAGVEPEGKSAEAVHHELQRAGFFVAHVLECPLNGDAGGTEMGDSLAKRVGTTLTRIRRSIKPKRVALIGAGLEGVASKFTVEALGCEVLHDGRAGFKVDGSVESSEHLRRALALSTSTTR
jgi:hypothetical protein